jgi:two-component system sensor histidine kinase KdpD
MRIVPAADARSRITSRLRKALYRLPFLRQDWQPAAFVRPAIVTSAVVVATLLMIWLDDHLGLLNALLLYLLLCFMLALFVGSGPAALAAVLSVLAFNFFFVPPVHTFDVAQTDNILALFVFLGVAVMTGHLVADARSRAAMALREQARTGLLHNLNAALISDVTPDAILANIAQSVVEIYGAKRSRILLPDFEGRLAERARFPAEAAPRDDRQSLAVAARVMETGHAAGRSSADRRVISPSGLAHPAGVDVLYLPIATADRTIGVLEIAGRPGGGRFAPEDEQLLGTFASQAALVLERARLIRAAAEATALAESDALKTALLASLSHDLRTPLAVIKASSSSLLDDSVPWDEESRSEFIHAIDEETDRLTRMVDNLLDLTRIQGGTLRPDPAWYDVAELLADVTSRPAVRTPEHAVRVEMEPNLPLVCIDYMKIAQAVTNLIENATKYTPAGTPIAVTAHARPEAVEIAVTDAGPGIPPRELDRIFDAFYRAPHTTRIPGSGLGLAIARGFIEAHGGRIWAESRPGAGTSVRFTIPTNGARSGE